MLSSELESDLLALYDVGEDTGLLLRFAHWLVMQVLGVADKFLVVLHLDCNSLP